ncbi:MAG: 16S rRNA processing protein RimM [Thermoflexales bacterium]|nr:16S rRNA processing protein RimM [Thermoflexales bacterium]
MNAAPEPRFLTVARVGRAWGLRGEFKLQALAERPDELLRLGTLYLGESQTPCQVERFHWHRAELLLKLVGCDDRSQAETLHGQLLRIRLEDAPPLGPNEYYCHQLLGLKVVTLEGEELGTLDAIWETGANDVYVVRGARGEILLPACSEVIRQIDLEHGLVLVHLLPGLL